MENKAECEIVRVDEVVVGGRAVPPNDFTQVYLV